MLLLKTSELFFASVSIKRRAYITRYWVV